MVLPTAEVDKILAFDDVFAKTESELVDCTRAEAKMEFAYDETAGTYSYDSKYMTISQFTENGNPGTNGDSSFYAGNDEDGAYQQLAPVMVDRTGTWTFASFKQRFNIDDTYIYGAMPVQVEVEYKTNSATKLNIITCTTESPAKDVTKQVNLNPNGKKNTVVFDIDDAYLANNAHATEKRDIILQGGTGLTYKDESKYLYIYSIKVRKPGDRLMKDLSL